MKGRLRNIWKLSGHSTSTVGPSGDYDIYYIGNTLDEVLEFIKNSGGPDGRKIREWEVKSIGCVDNITAVDIEGDWEGGPVSTRYYRKKNADSWFKSECYDGEQEHLESEEITNA